VPTRDWNASRVGVGFNVFACTRASTSSHALSTLVIPSTLTRRPLKIGIREDIIVQHPGLQPSVIVSALQIYTPPLRALLQHAHGRRGSD
jgi:hypothetical protein